MKISPYLKALLYVLLFLFIYMFIMASISIFITHSEQPAIFGVFTFMFMRSMALILVGLLQVKQARRNGERKSWYQQYEVSLGLSLLCFLFVLLEIGLFNFLPRTLLLLRIENWTLLFIMLLCSFFVLLSIKYYPSFNDGKPRPSKGCTR